MKMAAPRMRTSEVSVMLETGEDIMEPFSKVLFFSGLRNTQDGLVEESDELGSSKLSFIFPSFFFPSKIEIFRSSEDWMI